MSAVILRPAPFLSFQKREISHLLLFGVSPLLLLCCSLPRSPVPTPADLVLRNGQVYTVDAARSWAEAIAIRAGRIVAVGTAAEVEPSIGPRTRVVDLGRRMVLPGFHDSHVHPLSGGVELGQCNLNNLQTRDAVFDAIRTYAQSHGTAPWIVGGGFELPLFPNGSPRKDDLDRLVPDRPVMLSSADGHSAWVNSKALTLAGVDRNTPDPPAGRIERNPDGSPSGTLRESAMSLVGRLRPKETPGEHDAGLKRGLEMANRLGITSLVEASAGPDYLTAYERSAAAGQLTARVLVSLHVSPNADETALARLADRGRRVSSPRLEADAAKIFVDGVIEGGTASLLDPYLHRPGDRGDLNLDPATLTRIVTRLYQDRMQVHLHAIGDRAIRVSLDAIEAARKATGWVDGRPHVAHIQLFDPADIPRFRRLGVIANFQPLWAYADSYIKELTEPRLGPARSRWLYPIRTVLATGAVVVGGSDWSVSSMNPLEAMQIGVTRLGLADTAGKPWIADERATLAELIAAYTINGAYLRRMERETGSIEVGKLADLIVLDRNLFDVPPAQIHKVTVQLTLLDGAPVFSDGTLDAR
jgi:predicted amidohydrolase YtcJ